MDILFFEPIPRFALWGHTLVKDYFHFSWFKEGVGQAWAFSTQEESNICFSDPFKGKTLQYLWTYHQELFGHPNEEFPVIISLLAPEDDLSIQVHPNDEYALSHGYKMGKNEAWYFIEAEADASIVYGHNAKNKEELKRYIEEERWEELIKTRYVNKEDFIYLPAGILHAMKKGSIVYEIQQATDITYRFYDYHRKDKDGRERKLHLKEAIECLSYDPHITDNILEKKVFGRKNMKETEYISNRSFTVKKLEIFGKSVYQSGNYQLATVIKGEGIVNNHHVSVGTSFLIPLTVTIHCDGAMTIMMTTK